jgi:hypothetical protein
MNSRGMKTCICDNPRDIYNFVIEYMRSFILQKHAYERCNYLDELDPDRTAELSKGNWHQAQHTSRSTHDATDSAATREQNAKRLPTHGYQKISNILVPSFRIFGPNAKKACRPFTNKTRDIMSVRVDFHLW